MAKIKPSLNLNGTPQAVENYSLVNAHNIAVNEEGAIIPDYGVKGCLTYAKTSIDDSNGILGIIVGLNSKLYVFYKNPDGNPQYAIDEYDEINRQIVTLQCAWTYHGGKITGNVTVNNTNEYILNICESDATVDVPIKHINLSKCSSTDDESIYTQNPNIPITNLYLNKTYTKNIPNGVYQFFVRYRIRDEFYTGWFPCSKECFAGVSQVIRTVQGQIKHVKTNIDAAKSFIFNVEHIFNGDQIPGTDTNKENFTSLYKDYQIGFILSTNDSMVARSWKSFNFDVTQIKFDYDESAIEDVDIKEMLEVNYEIFNVKNIAYFRNKQYISNFKETDFNPDLENTSKLIGVRLDKHEFNTDGIFVDGKELTDEDETSGGTVYYKKWGNKNAYEIITNQNLVNKNRTEITISTKDSYDSKQYGFYEYTVKCDYSANPDLLWVCKGKNNNDISNFPFSDFDDSNNRYTTAHYFRLASDPLYAPSNGTPGATYTLYKDTKTHPWNNNYYTRRKWRYASVNGGSYICPNTDNFSCADNGFGNNEEKACMDSVTAVADCFKKNKVHFGACKIVGAYVLVGTTKYFIYGDASTIDESDPDAHLNDPFDFTGYSVDNRQEASDSYIENLVKSKIIGVTQNGNFIGKFGNNEVVFDKYYIVYSEFDYYCSNPTSGSVINNIFRHDIRVDIERRNYRVEKSCEINDRYIKINNASDEKQYNTLLPFTEYEFYVHYVKQNGIVTNGYIINNGVPVIMDSYDGTNYNAVIYPIFSNISLPDGYVSCFFSVYKTGNDICKCFNHELRNDGYHYVDCLEADTLLYNIKNKIVIIDNDGVELTSSGDESQPELVQAVEAEYYSSSDFTPVEMIGNSGCIRWKRNAVTDAIDYEDIEDLTYSKVINPDGEYISFLFNGGNGNKFANYFVEAGTAISNDVIANIQRTIRGKIDSEHLANYFDTANVGRMTGTERGLTFNFATKHYETTISGHTLNQNFISLVGIGFGSTVEIANNDAILHRREPEHPIDGDELWVKINNTYSTNKDRQLIRITPYIDTTKLQVVSGVYGVYDNYEDLNTPGYLCKVYKPNRNYSNDIYVSGTDIYNKDIASANAVKLDPYYDIINLNTSNSAYILSNFNLNYVSLNEEINPQVRTYKTSADDTIGGIQIIKALNSLTASFILQLESMYRNYLRKYYYVYDPNKLTQFDNTIRSSDVNTDEVYRNIYKFYSEDYYNVPVNRGPIVNMFAVLNEIYIHCEHSLFKFNGNNTLTANEGEVSLKDSNVFDTGIVEIFDSQHGYAGLSEKHHSLVTFNYYIFYDKLNNKLYAYDTQKGLVNLGKSIQYIINHNTIDDVVFADDINNNRILISFILNTSHLNIRGNYSKDHITLSFNFETNSFISIHDFTFRFSVSSRLYCYLIQAFSYLDTIMDVGYRIEHNKYLNNNNVDNALLFDYSYLSPNEISTFNITSSIPSSVDIIYNVDYEKIKVFNNVSWICNKLTNDIYGKYIADNKMTKYAGHKFIIYSDQIYSNMINTGNNGDDISNNYNLDTPDWFKKVRYNNGIFEINYFRHETLGIYPETEVPLIHGKYFVFRIYFAQYDFRLENVTINCQNYEKA